MTTQGRLVAVNTVHEIRPDPHGDVGRTAIDKRPVDAPVRLIAMGPDGDTVMDRYHHGGVDQAVYSYAAEDLAYWSTELGREIPPGKFGENLTTKGVDITGAVIGTVWTVGETRLQVRSHRTPCSTFQQWMDEPRWVRRFTEHGAPGAYLKVLTEGWVKAGDPITIESIPDHGVTIGELFAGRRGDRDRLASLLEQPDIADDVIEYLNHELAVGQPPQA